MLSRQPKLDRSRTFNSHKGNRSALIGTRVVYGYTDPSPGSTMTSTREDTSEKQNPTWVVCHQHRNYHAAVSLGKIVAVTLGFIRLPIFNHKSVTLPGRRRGSSEPCEDVTRVRYRYYVCRKRAAAGFSVGRTCSPDSQCSPSITHQLGWAHFFCYGACRLDLYEVFEI